MSNLTTQHTRLPGLDGLRGISVLLVIFTHVAGSPGWPGGELATNIAAKGNFGVEVFFVLSGFLITWLLVKEEKSHGSLSLWDFYIRRVIRILPPALAYIGVIALIKILAFDAHPIQTEWTEFLSAAFFYRNLYEGGGVELGHYWSLAIEEQFYLAWPLLFLVIKNQKMRIFVTLTLIGFAPIWRQVHIEWYGAANVLWKRTDLRYDALMVGCLYGLLLNFKRPRTLLMHSLLQKDLSFLLMTFLIVFSFTPIASLAPGYILFTYPTLRFFLIVGCTNFLIHGRNERFFDWLFQTKVLSYLGLISYSLYLWQQIFCYSELATWDKWFPTNILLAIICASASYHGIERPILKWRLSKGIGTRPPPKPADDPRPIYKQAI